MSRIEQLIEELCPDGVEFLKIGNLAQVGTGSSDRKNAVEGGEFPFYVRSKDVIRIDKYEFDEEAIVIPGEGGIGEIFHYVTGKYALHQRAYRIHFTDERVNTRFAYFFFNVNFKKFILQKAVSATVTSIRKPMITDFSIPVPPFPVQQEIVRILDMFTQLEAELEAELEARRYQYDYYRNALFADIDTSGEWRSLGLHGVFQRGSALQKKHLTDKGTPCFHYGEVYTHYGISAYETKSFVTEEFSVGKRVLQPGDLFIATTSENEEDLGKAVAWLGKTPAVASSDALIYRTDLDPRYVSHYFSSIHFNKQKLRYITGTKVKRLSDRALAQIAIPVPQLEKQREVANILDKFDTIVNDLSFGLPAEIVARRKQYEYYRDKLLTFKKLSA